MAWFLIDVYWRGRVVVRARVQGGGGRGGYVGNHHPNVFWALTLIYVW